MSDNLNVFISIVHYRKHINTINCIESILDLNYYDYHIIIINNSYSHNSINFVKNYLDENSLDYDDTSTDKHTCKIKIINSKYNKGYASGCNIAIKYIVKNYGEALVWVINNDIIVSENSLSLLVYHYYKNNNKNKIIGCSVYRDQKMTILESAGCQLDACDYTTTNITSKKNPDYIPGTSLFFNSSICEIIGFLPEEYFMYYEDVDWSTKARLNDISLEVSYKSEVFHDKNPLAFKLKLYSFINRYRYAFTFSKLKFIYLMIHSPIYILKIINKFIK